MRYDGRNPYGSKGGYVRDHGRDYDDYDYEDMEMYDRRRGDRRYSDGRRYDIEMETRDSARYDRHSRGDKELKQWSKRLLSELEDKHKQLFNMEHVTKRAEEMGIRFEEFSPFELYTTALMLFTDFKDALSTTNLDIYLKMAKYWLCDEDAELQYGEKLRAYYETIVNGF